MFLCHKHFDSPKILSVAHQHDLAADVDLQLVEFLEVLRRPVIGIDHIGLDVARGRHAIEGHDHSRIVLIRIAFDTLTRGPMHFDPGRRSHIDTDLRGIVHPDFVLDNLSIEPCIAKFLRDIVGGRFVLDGARHVGIFCENAQMLFGKLGIGHCQEARFRGLLRSRIPKTEDGRGCSGRCGSASACCRR